MKYQVILESEELLDDQEFTVKISDLMYLKPFFMENVRLVEARSLEGIREELWKKKDTVIDSILHAKEPSEVIETTFEEIQELFKI